MAKLREEFQAKILQAKKAEFSGFLYPELKCGLVVWWGYYFWKICDKFDIKEQIKYLEGLNRIIQIS